MKITKIMFDESQTSKMGLREIKLDRLGSVVALIGKNGSGKTRILNFIENNFDEIANINSFLKSDLNKDSKGTYNNRIPLQDIDTINQELFDYKLNRLRELRGKVKTRSRLEEKHSLEKEINELEIELKKPIKETLVIPEYIKKGFKLALTNNDIYTQLKSNFVKRIRYDEIRQLQDVITKNDEVNNSFEQLIESIVDEAEYNELGSLYKSSLRFLRKLPNQLALDWIDCLGDTKKFEKRVAFIRYKALKAIFDQMFGKTLEWKTKSIKKNITEDGVESTITGFWHINNRDFNYSEFSEGEKTLFAFVLLFFLMSQNKNIRLKESIIIIDEPELHLHPDAEIDLIKGIRNIIADSGQLWIATHSLNILSHLNYDEVFVVKDGQIFHPSRTIQKEALTELMQIEDRVQKLTEFLISISEWSFSHFIIECFTNPDVIEIAGEDDPQIKTFKEIIKSKANGKNSLLLDFGAGKGRLLEKSFYDEKFKEVVECSALEPQKEYHKLLSSKGIKKIYSSHKELPKKTFDFIVLCNVLHEIELSQWIPTINSIIESLNISGHLLIIEAKILSKGEKVGKLGYFLLDQYEIQILFNLNQTPKILKHADISDSITSVLIPKNNLELITKEDVLKTLKALEANTLYKIEELRKKADEFNSNNKLGREAAFLSQLHINSRLALKYFEN
ncbi:MAG: AAA family ATPase [Bacteroidales bacterium]|nr:AAA family ATPase [Bacteroidales bacterium]